MTKAEILNEFLCSDEAMVLHCDTFFERLADKLECSQGTAMQIWYAEQRSWFEPEMVDELIRLEGTDEWKPNLASGEFEWKNGRFVPE